MKWDAKLECEIDKWWKHNREVREKREKRKERETT